MRAVSPAAAGRRRRGVRAGAVRGRWDSEEATSRALCIADDEESRSTSALSLVQAAVLRDSATGAHSRVLPRTVRDAGGERPTSDGKGSVVMARIIALSAHQTLPQGHVVTGSIRCSVDRRPCEVTDWFPSTTPKHLRPVLADRPCERCRVGEETVRRLATRRLGEQERWVLRWLLMASSRDAWAEVPAIPDTRSERESVSRAIRTLRDAGMVVTGRALTDRKRVAFGRRHSRVTKARFTAIGEIVAEQIATLLEVDERIRWPKLLPFVKVKARLRGLRLARQFAERVNERAITAGGKRREGYTDQLLGALKSPRRPDQRRTESAS